MPSVKISELPVLSKLSNNTANTVFVGINFDNQTTSKFTTAVLADGLFANAAVNVGTTIVFSDSSTQSVAAAPANYTQSAYNVANTATNNILILQAVNTSQNSYAYAVNQYAESGYATANGANGLAASAFNKANNALANTTGTFAGDLTIAGNNTINGYTTISKSNFGSSDSLVKITAADGGSYVAPSNSYYMMHITGKANNSTRFVLDSFGANTYPIVSGRAGRGSASAPAATSNNDVMMRIVGNGYTGTQFPSSSPTKIDFVATENFSDTNRGTAIQFWNTPNGSNTIQRIASFNANEVSFTGIINPQKGFIFTPRVPVGNQTSIALDFSSDVIIKAELVADCAITLSNYISGKVVEVWLINQATGPGANKTITHGCTATNSTVNSTTFSLSGTSSAYLRYFSIDGDNANTFVSIQYS